MFVALAKRRKSQNENYFFPFACLMAMYHNAHIDPKKDKPIGPDHFMPGEHHVKKVTVSQFAQLVKSGAYGA